MELLCVYTGTMRTRAIVLAKPKCVLPPIVARELVMGCYDDLRNFNKPTICYVCVYGCVRGYCSPRCIAPLRTLCVCAIIFSLLMKTRFSLLSTLLFGYGYRCVGIRTSRRMRNSGYRRSVIASRASCGRCTTRNRGNT